MTSTLSVGYYGLFYRKFIKNQANPQTNVFVTDYLLIFGGLYGSMT
jgi:hypothetical protein